MKVLTIVGARPQFVKAAAITRAIEAHNETAPRPSDRIAEVLVHTGQHYDHELSQAFFDELDLPAPHHHLGIGSGPHGQQTGRMLEQLEAVLLGEDPDIVLVHGDTNSTLAGALAATKLHLPLAHVEAGLRSYDKRMPEEVNRVATDHVSDLLFCPSQQAVDNLAQEGITDGVHRVGDVMQDMVHLARARLDTGAILPRFGLEPDGFALVTVHRQANTDDPARLAGIVEALDTLAREDLPVLLPLHPRTRNALEQAGLTFDHVTVTEPLPYGEILALQDGARLVLTDSGGLQKEAYWLGTPCITLRDETEWVETVEQGCNVLVGADPKAILTAARDPPAPASRPDAYGDAEAATRILDHLSHHARARRT